MQKGEQIVNNDMRQHERCAVIRWQLLKASIGLSFIVSSFASVTKAGAVGSTSVWWETECIESHAPTPDGERLAAATASFRNFSDGASPVSNSPRLLTFADQGLQYKLGGTKGLWKWAAVKSVNIRELVGPNGALAITVVTDTEVVSGGEFGNVEFHCWRQMERIIQRHRPEIIHGSPTR